jgi:CheY-like chemotaxis protein
MRLLIAEDDKALGQFLSRGLEADGHRVHLAYDGGAAVEAFRQELPDLTILDLNMPVKDGEQVLEEVRIPGGKRRGKYQCATDSDRDSCGPGAGAKSHDHNEYDGQS